MSTFAISGLLRADPTDLPDDVVTGITHGQLRELRSTLQDLEAETAALKLEIENLRRDHCSLCTAGRWGPAERKARKNGKLIRWQHLFDEDRSNSAMCQAGESREREFQRATQKEPTEA